jgi:hypothetical protein
MIWSYPVLQEMSYVRRWMFNLIPWSFSISHNISSITFTAPKFLLGSHWFHLRLMFLTAFVFSSSSWSTYQLNRKKYTDFICQVTAACKHLRCSGGKKFIVPCCTFRHVFVWSFIGDRGQQRRVVLLLSLKIW